MGGFLGGAKTAGFQPVWASDIDHNCAATVSHRFPETRVIEKPIEELSVKADHLAPESVGNLLLRQADVRANLIERSSTASNIPVASEIVLSLKYFLEIEKERRIYDRQVFRQWMIRINQLGGTLVLDAVPRKTLRKLVREEAKKALETVT